ncbi:MAG: ABC transporter substrate-binding protein [Protaetiibacter sp.]
MKHTSVRKAILLASGVIAAITLTSCAPGSSEPSAETSTSESDIALPSSLSETGVIRVATSFSYAPFTYRDESDNPAGFEIELAEAIAEELGVEIEYSEIAFASIIPSIETGRVDIGMNQLTDTAERQESVDFVDYFRLTYQVLVNEELDGITLDEVCGLNFGVTQGSTQIPIIQGMSDDCVADGEEAMTISEYPDTAQTLLAIASGQAEAFLSNPVTGLYYESTPDKHLVRVPGEVSGYSALAGIALPKGDTELAAAIQEALDRMVASGVYQEILDEYGAPDNGLTEFTINAGE